MKALVFTGLLLTALALFSGALLLLWVACCAVIQRRDRAGHTRHVPALPVDGRPLDDYEHSQYVSVLIGWLTSPDDGSVREDYQ